MIEIDGSYGEGGGSVLRVAAGFSVLTGKGFRVFNIRKNRKNPGLREQHLMGLKAVAELCNGVLTGAEVGSTEIAFTPGEEWKKKLTVRVGTAGSVGLVLQPLQIACLGAPRKVEIVVDGGATYGKWAPSIDYLEHVTYVQLSQMNYNIALDVETHGFYPVGGANVRAVFTPTEELLPLEREDFGKVSHFRGISRADTRLKQGKVSERQKVSCRQEIFKRLEKSPQIEEAYTETACPGTGLTIWAETSTGCTVGTSVVGEKGLRAEIVGKTAAAALCEEVSHFHVFDEHAADQLLPFMAICEKSHNLGQFKRTNHFETNKWVIEKFLERSLTF